MAHFGAYSGRGKAAMMVPRKQTPSVVLFRNVNSLDGVAKNQMKRGAKGPERAMS